MGAPGAYGSHPRLLRLDEIVQCLAFDLSQRSLLEAHCSFTENERRPLSRPPSISIFTCLRNASGVKPTRIPWQTLSHSVANPGMRVWQSSSAAAGCVSTGEAHVATAVADGHVAAVGAHRGVAHVLLQGQVL